MDTMISDLFPRSLAALVKKSTLEINNSEIEYIFNAQRNKYEK